MGLVFVFEIGALLLVSITAAAFMASVSRLSANPRCDLGMFRFVPYIWVHWHEYCLLSPTGALYTTLYYFASLVAICAAHYFYVWRRRRQQPLDSPRRYYGFLISFWALLFSWLFNFEGPRGDWGSLTDRSHLPFIAPIIVICVLHIAVILSKYQLEIPTDRSSAN